MKIKNFKLNQKFATKLTACVLAGSLTAMALSGCESKNKTNFLDGTVLSKTVVTTCSDGTKDIAVTVDNCSKGSFNHYRSIITGLYYAAGGRCDLATFNGEVVHHYDIVCEESIVNYLSSAELNKAMNSELTNDDIEAIISRTMSSSIEKTGLAID